MKALWVGLIGACVLCATTNAAERFRAGIWTEQVPGQRFAADPAGLAQALSKAGFETVSLSTSDLTNSSALNPEKLHILVLPNAASYPATGLGPLDRYLRGRGGLIAFGSQRFENPLFAANGRWLPLGSGTSVAFQRERIPWDLKNHGAEGPLRVSGDGTPDRPYVFDADVVKTSMYAGVKPLGLPAEGTIVCFQARGSKTTPGLCVELQETDGSRWKQIVKITEDWREYRVHSASFMSYATPKRTNDYFRPEKTKVFYIGLLNKTVGTGPQHFEVRNLKFLKADVPSKTVFESRIPLPGHAHTAAAFGNTVPALPAKQWPSFFDQGPAFEGALVVAQGHPLTAGVAPGTFGSAGGRLLAENPPVRNDPSGEPILLFPGAAFSPRVIPLLEAPGADNKNPLLAAALLVHRSGPYAGSQWAFFSADKMDMPPGLVELLGRTATYMASRTRVEAAGPEFTGADGKATVTFAQVIRNDSKTPVEFTIKSSLADKGGTAVSKTQQLKVPGSQSGTSTWDTASLSRFDWREYSAKSAVSSPAAFQDEASWNVNAKDALRTICDFFVGRSKLTGGKFSGTHYFIDHRGARALLAAYEIFGDERYRQAAISWALAMVAEQRTDGGYRMGYGVGTRGEACFVADGGEIGLGVARAACYATGAEKQKLLDSMKAYMGYRDSFRVEGGGIGVGWSFTDYGKRPPTKLRDATKIYAPEQNTYTIGCTLGAAYVWAALTGSEADMKSARADAEWFMARSKSLSGASAESFILAHALEKDPAQKLRYKEFLKRTFVQPAESSNRQWWLLRGARASLDANGMSYWNKVVSPDPLLEVQMARFTSAMCAKESPTSVYKLLQKPKLNHDEWIYLCFGGLSLAEVVQPASSFQKLPSFVLQN